MGTPISRNDRSDAFARYAPRRARQQAVPELQAPAPPQQTDCGLAAPATEQSSTTEWAEIAERVERAIREAIDLDHLSQVPGARGGRGATPQSAPPAMPQRPALDREALLSQSPRLGRVRTGAPPRSRLDPEMVPEPPAALHGQTFPRALRFCLAIVLAAVVAYGLTMLSPSRPDAPWFKAASERIALIASQLHEAPAESSTASRLVVEDREAYANEPLPLAVSVDHARDNESLLFDGLVQGTRLSAGSSTSPSGWRLPFARLRGLYVYAPKNFIGVMNTTVDLFGADSRLLDRRAMQLKWIGRDQRIASPPAGAVAGTPPPRKETAAAKPGIRAVEPMVPGEADMLMRRGRDFLNAGDISAARIVFGRLADAGIADAALALAGTYDPDYLAAHNVVGVGGDRATARTFYERAKQLGSAAAGQILAQMTPR